MSEDVLSEIASFMNTAREVLDRDPALSPETIAQIRDLIGTAQRALERIKKNYEKDNPKVKQLETCFINALHYLERRDVGNLRIRLNQAPAYCQLLKAENTLV